MTVNQLNVGDSVWYARRSPASGMQYQDKVLVVRVKTRVKIQLPSGRKVWVNPLNLRPTT